MLRHALALLVCCFLFSCKNKKPALSGEDPVDVGDFIESFPALKLPYLVGDTAVQKKASDTVVIAPKIFSQFVPDSVLSRDFGKNAKPRLYPIGRVSEKDKETYLFLKAIGQGKQVGYILAFDKTNQYKAGMSFLTAGGERGAINEGGMDRRFSIVKNRSRRGSDGQTYYRKNVYVYNNAGVFTLILTESNETVEDKEVYNPIDTFSKKNKYTGDYSANRKNFISFRDSRKANQLLFFVHFEKNNGDCTGELKGEVEFIKPNVAHFRQAGDPCVLQFSFTANNVTMSEVEGCGNHRGLRCFFEGTYPKKKEPKKAASKKK
jgi:hypothetical protein